MFELWAMTLWSTASVGKERKFLELYALKTIASRPQTGYDLLKEVEKKTGGGWIPSKGLVYPLLDEMEARGLIRVKEVGERSKKIYEITEEGMKELGSVVEKHKEMQERFDTFRRLFFETFLPSEELEMAEIFYELRKRILESKDKERAYALLKQVLEEIP